MFNNLLNSALSIIPTQEFTLLLYLGTTNTEGFLIPSYSAPISVLGSVQPMNIKELKYLGMSTTKETLKFWFRLDSTIVDGVDQKGSSKLIFKEKEYIIQESTNWYLMDGWCEVMGVQNG